MIIIQELFFALLLVGFCGRVYCKICEDCQPYTSCSEAFDIAHNIDVESEDKFKDLFCGVVYEDGDRIPKVCCSDFITQNKDIDKHPNIYLLPKSCGYIDNYPVSSGQANLYEFPWMTLMYFIPMFDMEIKCKGVIINSRYVLTTATCVQKEIPRIVRTGDYNPETDIDCMPGTNSLVCENFFQDHSVEETIRHINFSMKPSIKHNIAIVRLRDEIDFTHRNIAPLCLPIHKNFSSADKTNKNGIVVGWLDAEKGDFSKLMKQSAVIKPCTIAKDQIEHSFCATSFEEEVMFIKHNGDPFIVVDKMNDKINRYILYGLYSFGNMRRNVSDVYVDVSKYVEWILDNIKP